MNKLLKIAVVLLSFALNSQLLAQRIIEFENTSGWKPKDTSNVVSVDGLDVWLEVKDPGDKTYYTYKVYFKDTTGQKHILGVRVTPRYPSDSHAQVVVSPNETDDWYEYFKISEGITKIYVYIRHDKS